MTGVTVWQRVESSTVTFVRWRKAVRVGLITVAAVVGVELLILGLLFVAQTRL